MTKSASSVYVEYAYETGGFGSGANLNTPIIFGKEVKGSGLEFKNNQIPLGQLYTPEIESYAYGKDEGKVSMEYVLSNPWFFESILGTATSVDIDGAGAGTLYSHTWDSDPNVDSTIRDINSMALTFGFNVNNNFLRIPVGVICPSLSMKMALNETIKVTQELIWGEETVNQTFANPDGTPLAGEIPYTFVNAEIISPLTGNTLATVQTFDLNMNTNAELVYEFNQSTSTGAIRKILELTGKVSITLSDSTMLEEVYGRAESANDLVVTLTNLPETGNTDPQRSIKMTFSGCSFSTHNTTGIEPSELVIENMDFQCKHVTVVAKNQESAIPT